MMKSYLPTIILGSGLLTVSGCSSVMTHTGGQDGTYPGTRASYQMLTDSGTSWGYKPFVVLDMPFTAIADTVLVPWDLYRTDKSLKSKVEASENANLATNSVLPPVQ
ncbi:YceK/YidQ family lipoprotein [Buttiauxella selenatireducens]|uniref:YceK/YidQ family lipoprotein n=1 Tax=Buttiauxella selenatireducens TaxID=3073902 RepID=A0ABY9SC25_9ENTR|nr:MULTISPECIES: YceK/YidQ family lipoprotein [unclassified Buttiauxella]WMY74430.1 YceK/YidQ family lipoprotein [Buttiauxella sp. R73]